ncbi:MAG: nitrous oxide reductase accessory protein NosL [Rhodospirillum sp.]|nr:nitrous oxide reductase accessory protein NosL [Rhodospirillum sp.]MCF8490973.1 nitrous oxide reductase accessory protein NosL [Rhodospirillum sp.]MCF8501186.1 nitrous oxide reductase accessory protein NosL [Rhodospirillum sp.]
MCETTGSRWPSRSRATLSRRALSRWMLAAGAGVILPALAGGGVAQAGAVGAANAADLPLPGPMETCPVCGMLVAKYPDWIATVAFADGTAVHFDGAKDMVKYLREMPRYAQARTPEQVVGLAVTDYYDLSRIDPRTALFVVGSDVLGPMGHEPIPLANDIDAQTFLADHAGKAVLPFDAVTLPLMLKLDDGDFSGLGS